MNKLTEKELNIWAAEFLGIKVYQKDCGDIPWLECKLRVYTDGVLDHQADIVKWTPCTNRNQAQLVVEKLDKSNLSHAEMDRFYAHLPSAEFDSMDFLLSSPRQLVEAAYRALNYNG